MRYDHFMRLVRMKVLERGRMLVGEEHMGLAHALVQHDYNQNSVLRVPHIHRATLASKNDYHKIISELYMMKHLMVKKYAMPAKKGLNI